MLFRKVKIEKRRSPNSRFAGVGRGKALTGLREGAREEGRMNKLYRTALRLRD